MILAALLLALPGPPPQVPPPPKGEVTLEARAVVIPPLPTTVAQAEREYGKVRKELEASYRDAERYLSACNTELAGLGPPESRLTISASAAGEAKLLAGFLFDGAFLSLEDPLMERWNGWQSTLLSLGLDLPDEGERLAHNMMLLSSSKTEVVGRVTKIPTTLELLMEDPDNPDGTLMTLPRRVNWVEVVAVSRMNYGAHTEFGRQARSLADTQAGKLARDWAPLTAHLNAGAKALLDFDRTAPPTADPSLKTLRVLARINFMERFRSTLWFCQVVWAHMASEKVLPIRLM